MAILEDVPPGCQMARVVINCGAYAGIAILADDGGTGMDGYCGGGTTMGGMPR